MFTPVDEQKPPVRHPVPDTLHLLTAMVYGGGRGLSSGETEKFHLRCVYFSFPPLVPEGKMVLDISMFPISTRVKASCEARHVVNDRKLVF